MTAREKAVERIVDGLQCSIKEAEEIYEADRAIDRGEHMDFDLSAEEHKKAIKQANAKERKAPTAYKFETRERKPNEPKRELIEILHKALEANVQNIEIVNLEREIVFTFNEVKYKIVLSAPRK